MSLSWIIFIFGVILIVGTTVTLYFSDVISAEGTFVLMIYLIVLYSIINICVVYNSNWYAVQNIRYADKKVENYMSAMEKTSYEPELLRLNYEVSKWNTTKDYYLKLLTDNTKNNQ
jgi:hypothetical protein